MKKRILLALGFLVVLSIPLFALVPDASAATCNGIETSINFHCDDYNTDGVSAILMYVINFMAIGVGIAVVIGIIFGGIKYASSDGEEAKAKEGREMITNSIIGLFLFIFLYAGANFLIPGGAFNLNAKPAAVASSSGGSSSGGGSSTGGGDASTTPELTGISNFRDAATATGVLKSGILYRSGLLADATSDDKTELATLLKGGMIIDLRASSDIERDGQDPTIKGVDYRNIAITGTTDYTKFVNNPASAAAFGKAIKLIINNDGPFLIHCTHGKDRTGWLVAMVMYAAGASDNQVMSEYMKSKGQATGKTVTEEMLNNGLSAIKQKYGTVQKYLKNGLGLSSDDIAALKKKLAA